MPDVQEVFHMATQKVRPDPGFVDRQHDRMRRRQRNRKVAAIAAVGAICIATAAVILLTRGGRSTSTPVGQPATSTIRPLDLATIETASGFAATFADLDAEGALDYLADGAEITELTGTGSSAVDLRHSFAWFEATGFQAHFGPCLAGPAGTTSTFVTCPFDFHALRSDEIGAGPFAGSTLSLTVSDGQISRAAISLKIDEFSPRVWEPFGDWVSTTYPMDVDAMYVDGSRLGLESHTARSIRLWEEHTKEYAQRVNRG
jgi:hypothetical protein